MPVFNYTATDALGSRVTGSYEAVTEKEVRLYLSKRNLTPTKVKRNFFKADIQIGSGKVKLKDLLIFTKMFAVLSRAAIPTDQALRVMQRQTTSKGLKKSLHEVIVKAESGGTLAEAMRSQPKAFDSMYADMVQAGEASGSMDTLLLRLADLLYKTNAVKTKIRGAMVYPVVLALVAVAAVAALLIFVIPKFRDFFAGLDLPWPTRVVMGLGDFLGAYWWAALGAIGFTVLLYVRLMKLTAVLRVRDGLALKVPVIRDVIQKQAIARFSRTLSTLITSGVSVIDGLEMTAGVTGNLVITEAIRQARATLTAGGQLSVALEESGLFPPMVTSMIDIGEQTGQLERMLDEIATFYEDEVNAAVDAMLKLVEPIMLVVLGGVVGMILSSLYLPLFDMIQAIEKE